MHFSNPVFAYGVILAWLIHAIISLLLKKQYRFFIKYYQGVWLILGYVGALLLGILVWQITSQLLNGFMYEQFVFMSRTLGNFSLWILGVEILLPILFLLNLFEQFRKNKILRIFQMVLIFILITIGILLNKDFATSVIPGWHTTIYKTNLPFIVISAGVIILLLNLLFIKNKITSSK
jgi:hypothetical protein